MGDTQDPSMTFSAYPSFTGAFFFTKRAGGALR